MKRLLVVASGTLGDILPVCQVLNGLSPGIEVDVVSNGEYRDHFPTASSFTALPFEPSEVVLSRAGQLMIGGGGLGTSRIRGLRGVVHPQIRPSLVTISQVATSRHVILVSGLPFGTGLVANAVGADVVRMLYQPHWPNDDNKSLYLNFKGEPCRHLRRYSHSLTEVVCRLLFRREIERSLQACNFSGDLLSLTPKRMLLHESYWLQHRTIFCIPTALNHSVSVGAQNAVSAGFIRFQWKMGDVDVRFWRAVEQLKKLDEPTVFIGFGSMRSRRTHTVTRIVAEAASKLGVRPVVQGSPDSPMPKSTIVVPRGPHDLLFPLMQGLVIHGGAGTVASALRSGTPFSVVPQWADQFFWANAMESRGLSIRPPRRAQGWTDVVSEMIRASADPIRRKQAADLVLEDAAQAVVAAVEDLVNE